MGRPTVFGAPGHDLRSMAQAGGGTFESGKQVSRRVAAAGAEGEQRTAAWLIEEVFPDDGLLLIFHSLSVPGMGSADMDHAVLSGNQLLLIDSKAWGTGRYTFLRGTCFHNGKVYEPGKTQTLQKASVAFTRFFESRGIPAPQVHTALVIHQMGEQRRRDGVQKLMMLAPTQADVITQPTPKGAKRLRSLAAVDRPALANEGVIDALSKCLRKSR